VLTHGALYLDKVSGILGRIRDEQGVNIAKAADVMAKAIANGGLVHVFGSGHSVIPALDIFPRYGSFPGFHPLLDPRLMWINVLGPGGVRELLWLERQEGYIPVFLSNFKLLDKDVLLVFSHGGLNAAPVEAVVAISMCLLAEIAGRLNEKGIQLPIFVSPNVRGFPPNHNQKVFAEYEKRLERR